MNSCELSGAILRSCLQVTLEKMPHRALLGVALLGRLGGLSGRPEAVVGRLVALLGRIGTLLDQLESEESRLRQRR